MAGEQWDCCDSSGSSRPCGHLRDSRLASAAVTTSATSTGQNKNRQHAVPRCTAAPQRGAWRGRQRSQGGRGGQRLTTASGMLS